MKQRELSINITHDVPTYKQLVAHVRTYHMPCCDKSLDESDDLTDFQVTSQGVA